MKLFFEGKFFKLFLDVIEKIYGNFLYFGFYFNFFLNIEKIKYFDLR